MRLMRRMKTRGFGGACIPLSAAFGVSCGGAATPSENGSVVVVTTPPDLSLPDGLNQNSEPVYTQFGVVYRERFVAHVRHTLQALAARAGADVYSAQVVDVQVVGGGLKASYTSLETCWLNGTPLLAVHADWTTGLHDDDLMNIHRASVTDAPVPWVMTRGSEVEFGASWTPPA